MNTIDQRAEECLREIIDLKFEKVDLRFKLLDKNHDLQKSETDKALNIQVKELERRLESLNDEAGRLKAMETKFVQSDLYDAKYTAMQSRLDGLSKLLYIGIGIAGVLQIALALVWVFFK